MFRTLHAAHRPLRLGLLPALQRLGSNFLREAGFRQTSSQIHANQAHEMSATAHHHRSFLSPPRDYMACRRLRRGISNAILIPLLSGLAAYFITRQTGGSGFSLPKAQRQAPLSTPLRPVSLVAHDEAHDNASTSWAARRRALRKALSQAQ
jgi:hypothetical protein